MSSMTGEKLVTDVAEVVLNLQFADSCNALSKHVKVFNQCLHHFNSKEPVTNEHISLGKQSGTAGKYSANEEASRNREPVV